MLQTHYIVRWREKVTPYNSQPSRLQNNRHVYKAGVTASTKHASRLQISRQVYNSQPSRPQNDNVTSTKQPSRLLYYSQPSSLQRLFCRRDGCE